MKRESFLNGRVILHAGDSRDVLKTFADNSIDSVVCDPPYSLVSIVKRFGKPGSAPAKGNEAYMRASAGFMGKTWDTGETAMASEFWAEVLRVLKPGAFVAAFGASRGYHRMACAIEDAGFEIRDSLMWVYGSGFPKSHDVSKGIDKAAGAERTEIVGKKTGRAATPVGDMRGGKMHAGGVTPGVMDLSDIYAPATPQAAEWEGWGTALKPAFEPIVLARKPLSEGTVAANVLKWRTGALNIGACRVESELPEGRTRHGGGAYTPVPDSDPDCITFGRLRPDVKPPSPSGRWPANVILDGSDEVVGMFPNTIDGVAGKRNANNGDVMKTGLGATYEEWGGYNGQGSAARFFYSAKADSDDRLGSKHPTVKPVDLMQWLCRLVTPPGGTILDCFAGTGTTGDAAFREGFNAVLIEREAEYQADIRRRMALCMAGPDERARESIKAKTKDQPVDHGPLFTTPAAQEPIT